MNQPKSIRLVAPITIGTALLGAGVYARQSGNMEVGNAGIFSNQLTFPSGPEPLAGDRLRKPTSGTTSPFPRNFGITSTAPDDTAQPDFEFHETLVVRQATRGDSSGTVAPATSNRLNLLEDRNTPRLLDRKSPEARDLKLPAVSSQDFSVVQLSLPSWYLDLSTLPIVETKIPQRTQPTGPLKNETDPLPREDLTSQTIGSFSIENEVSATLSRQVESSTSGPTPWSSPTDAATQSPPAHGLDEPALISKPAFDAVELSRNAVHPPSDARAIPKVEETHLAEEESQAIDLTPGRQVFPPVEDQSPITVDDELILQIRVKGIEATDTIIGYGGRNGVYLPLGELSRILDLAVIVGNQGTHAEGWFLDESRTVAVDTGRKVLATGDQILPWEDGAIQALDGEMYLRSDLFGSLFPLLVEPDLRSQSVLITTLEPFPFEERMRRDAQRSRLSGQEKVREKDAWPREDTEWLALSFPLSDVELRAVSDSAKGPRGELDIRLSGDVAWMTGQAYFNMTTRDGLVASLVGLGRRDVDGDLLGPLEATEFQIGDVATTNMPLGLRGTAGRGGFVTNEPIGSLSVFDQIDLRGVLPDGYDVELYRNDVLLGSTRTPVNGQYEFLQVPVDYGVNLFRLVFYGPQGQRREELRQINVGDGRLSPGKLQYSVGMVQRNVNLLGVEGPDFRPLDRYGDWQAVGEVAYGINQAITGVASAALFQDGPQDRWLATAGIRTGIGTVAIRADAGLSQGGGRAVGLGLGGRAFGGAFTVSHFEYGGNFIDEVRSLGSEPLRRASEADLNLSLGLAGIVDGTTLPLTVRGRHLEFADGRTQSTGAVRGSLRIPGYILSNTLEFSRNTTNSERSFFQLAGNFDLATFNRSSTQFRGTVGYRIAPEPSVTLLGAEVNHAFDERTVVRGSAAYGFASDSLTLGLSAIREFDKFTVAFDSNYTLDTKSYAVALRLGLSFGRDPVRKRLFVSSPGLSGAGVVAARVFHDRDGDSLYGPGDVPLPEVDIAVFNNSATTDRDGFARLARLGNGNRVSVQLDPSTLPDIYMAPESRGIEIVPRAGRVHITEFPILNLSEIEGTVSFKKDDSNTGVSGIRMGFQNEQGEIEEWVQTQRDGYYFYERVKPGPYSVILDPDQAERLNLCIDGMAKLVVFPEGSTQNFDLTIVPCD